MVSEKKTQSKKSTQKKETSSKKKVSSHKKEQSKEQFQLADLQPIIKKILIPTILIIAVVWYAFVIRIGTASLDGLEQNVESQIQQNIQQIISQQVQQQYPNLDQRYQQERVAEEYQKVIDTGTFSYQGQEINIDDLVQQQADALKQEFKADNGQTYLAAIDPYLFFNYATDVLENGHKGDQLKEDENGEEKPFASYRVAPEGKFVGELNLHEWLQVKMMEFQGVTPESDIGEKIGAIFFLSAIVAALSAIPCYLIIRHFSNDVFATIATLLMVSVGTFVSRTVAGFVDTDAYVVFFSLAVVASLVYAFVYSSKIITISLAILAGFFQGLFIWAWGSGWFIFLFSIVAFIGYIVYQLLIYYFLKLDKKTLKEKISNTSYTAGTYFIFSIIFTYIIAGNNLLLSTYSSIQQAFDKIASVSTTNIWPNVFSTVAELNPASFSQILETVGGSFIFFIAILGLVLITLDYRAKDKQNELIKKIILAFSVVWLALIVFMELFVELASSSSFMFLIVLFIPVALGLLFSLLNNNTSPRIFIVGLLSIWIAGTIFMSFNGTRFILLLTPAFAVAFGISLYYIANAINSFFTNEFKIENKYLQQFWGTAIMVGVFIVLFAPMGSQAMQISQGTTPNFDDSWFDAMEEIRTNSDEDAIITSWWDFGHFFAAISERGVTFDGGSQTTPQSHWVGKLLVETDEDVSVDILKMLTCGGNQAFERISNITDDQTNGVKTNDLIYKTLGESREDTIEILNNYEYHDFTEEEIDDVIQYLDCKEPRENLLITSGDMVNKGAVWSHWGLWDFTKKYVRDNYKDDSAEKIAEDLDKNQSLIEQYIDELEEIDVRASTQESASRDDLLNEWFSPYPGYADAFNCRVNEDIVECQNGLQLNRSSGEVITELQRGNSINRIIYPEDEELEIVEKDSDGNLDLLVLQTGEESVQIRAMQTPLGTSLFTKLYFLEGRYNDHFENFYDTQTQTAGNVIVWKTLFDGKKVNNSQNTTVEIDSTGTPVGTPQTGENTPTTGNQRETIN